MSSNFADDNSDYSTHTAVARDEEAPLLQKNAKKPRTPLPTFQLTLLLSIQLAEPITAQCIFPFINQLVSELDITGGDERKVGYYAGLIESLFYVTQALTVLQWNRLSDQIGRKPVLLIGLVGLCGSMVGFGLSRTFWALVISRCFNGMLNGNIGIMKTMVGELTDSTNMAQGFAMIPIVWSAGAALGPFMGGTLARPHDRFPSWFSGSFWINYPYFLPCATAAAFTAFCFIIVALFLKETLPTKQKSKYMHKNYAALESNFSQQETHNGVVQPSVNQQTLPSLSSLFIPSVLIPVANYGALAFVEIAMFALQPLFYSTPIKYGGLGFEPSTIGMWMGLFGLVDGLFQIMFVAMIIERWGPKRIYMVAVSCFLPIYTIFPIISWAVKIWGVSPVVWFLLSCQLCLMVVLDMAFACIFMFITASSPTKLSLGAVNGLSQTTASISRAVAPAVATSLFAVSIQYDIFGGNAVWAVLLSLSLGAMYLGSRLPEELQDRD
ncbi:hypothetical protein SERLA73DRAFT_115664 [Serpula lacrymans var. lacrymans S7.3]|uniref:Major facilitator superfamily (MFS) profile domain-containing protein n=2 Tax=Serpula lacrymans var. lacrymans TaxID=341189 RepID=F8QDH1_SERL3|nr:uncharacterized protein SERLADRAFT_453939 [Serpula lacrymans var. lacrymans S7.9]EGN93642.1 hypothetical protein SERLA73DRAFT_115664 [Serpula lacrymans var. lacrymans S7.3]EGO19019.1 hypothetical protein SERLADRAFT_453939 [Serpula lacrymans var. lacrymans S7.9]